MSINDAEEEAPHILVVDDDARLRELLQRSLSLRVRRPSRS